VRQWRHRGERTQAVGRSRGGRTTKIHALTDGSGRPLAFVLTGGQAADCRAGEQLLGYLPTDVLVHADKGYDSDRLRRRIEASGSVLSIPPKSNRIWKNCFSPYRYRDGNAVKRMFGRLKDFRRIAHPLRSPRPERPQRRMPCGNRQLLVMSLEPKWKALP